MDKVATAQPEMSVWRPGQRVPGGPAGIFMSLATCPFWVPSSIKNIKSYIYDCVCIKMTIIQAGFIITYSLLL